MFSQIDLGYQVPSKEILELADVNLPPATFIDNKGEVIVLAYRNQYKSIEELSQPELRLAGLRINPTNNTGSRTRHFIDLKIKIPGEDPVEVKGLPEKPKLSGFTWSPDQRKIAFVHTHATGAQLWVLDIPTATARKLADAAINGNMSRPYTWFRDNKSLLLRILPEDRNQLIDRTASIPSGPKISVNDGQKAQNRTYQDLLKDRIDETNFETLAQSTIVKIDLDGKMTPWLKTDMYTSMGFSPDGEYVMLTRISRPFSYLVPYNRFPTTYEIRDKEGKLIETLEEVPLMEELPKGFNAVRKGRRRFQWRGDKPHTIVYVMALDEGDPAKKVEYRDEAFTLEAPFNGEGKSLIKVHNRFSGIEWGTDNMAMAYDFWWSSRNTKTYKFDPSNPGAEPNILFDRNYQDRYSSPGSFVSKKNEWDRNVLDVKKGKLTLMGAGYTAKGIFPFIDEMDVESGETKRVWQAEDNGTLERMYNVVDLKKGIYLSRVESPSQYPTLGFRNIKKGTFTPLTNFKNPYEAISNAHKEVIKYKREDGVDLSAVLYLPPGYDKEKKEKLPMIMWAYPYEFKDKSSAGQITSSPYEFTYPYYGSPIYWLMKGYAVLDDASFPIIGEGKTEPNDSFIKQLVANAKAGIDAVDELGYIDRERVAVGGHSYGAFMTANLLSHSDLFAAGIARSGAYNRTLTPFGFQSEERNYWEAPEVYYGMSPFMHAEKMKTPLLLIHGMEDNNSGTYPMQSERYFNALKGLGATVRLVMLPKESHGYSARESVLHILWEQDMWLDKYVMNKKKNMMEKEEGKK
ncbi:MAG: prolyl oligopeptidase family serine peptidase [Bacteroidota bacterium]